MSFLAPLWLALAGLALAVLALHMVRRREVIVPSLMLWRRLNRPERSVRRLQMPRITLPLVLQMLIVLFAAAALAQPIIDAMRSDLQHRIFVLDRSASMQTTDGGASRYEQARAALAGRLAELDTSGLRVSVLTVGGPSRLVAARQSDAPGLTSAIGNIPVTGGEADWAQAADLMAATVRSGEATDIAVLTDGSDARVGLLETRFPQAERHILVFGEAGTSNAGLVAGLDRQGGGGETANQPWVLSGTLTVSGDMRTPPIAIAFQPAGGEQALDWGTIEADPVEGAAATNPDAPPEPVRRQPFETELDLPGSGLLTVSIPDDAGPHDNTLFFEVNAEPASLSILYIGEGNPRVVGALEAIAGADVQRATTLPQTAGFDLVVADDAVLPERPQTNTLWLGTARLADGAAPAVARDAEISQWREEHPLSREIDWSRLAPQTVYGFEPLAGASVVVEAGEVPVVEARTLAHGREVRAALDLDAGWVQGPEFPIFVENVVAWLNAGAALVIPCHPGESCAIPANLAAARIEGPDGGVVRAAIGAQGDMPLDTARTRFMPMTSGIFTIGEGRAAVTRIVNPVADESAVAADPDLASLQPDAAFADVPHLWWWLTLVVLLLLVLEAALAGRGLWRAAFSRASANARTRRWLAQMGVRAGAIVAVGLALIALPFPAYAPIEDVVVVMGMGVEGGDPARQQLAQRVNDRCDAAGSGSRLGLVALEQPGRIVKDIGCDGPQGAGEAEPLGMGTSIARSLDVAAAMIAPERAGRIILASGGSDTVPTRIATILGETHGVPVDGVAFEDTRPADAYVSKVIVPDRVFEGDFFPLTAIVNAGSALGARVRIFADGEQVAEREVELAPGGNRVETTIPPTAAGSHSYAVSVAAEDDPVPINDRNGIAVTIAPAPRVALVTSEAASGRFLADALAVQGLEVEIVPPTRAPYRMSDWLVYDAVVLLNVPAIDLDTRQQEQIDTLVSEHGRGLVILGGENTFGPGGYYRTPLDRISPLSSRTPEDGPAVALAFVLDRSGSMQALVEGVTRLEIAKEAANSAVSLLNPDSQVAIVVFDSEATALVPLQERLDSGAVAAALDPLVPGGGTSVYPALEMALDELEGAQAEIRHIIVMSDGLSQPGESEAIIARAGEMGVTMSAVAIGRGADAGRLEGIARAGGGSFNKTEDFRALPGILSQEAMMLGGDPMETGPFPVDWVERDADFLAGFPDALPDIDAIVETTAKDAAHVHLVAQRDDDGSLPLMASWRYGVGQVLAFASHGAGPGTRNWAAQPYYPRLWSQIIRHVLPGASGPGLALEVRREGDVLIGEVEAVGESGAPRTGLAPAMRVERDGELRQADIAMGETAPGVYSARFVADQPGLYAFEATAGEQTAQDRFAVSYPARYDFSHAEVNRLRAIARDTGGQMVSAQEANLVAARGWVLASAFQPWLLIALALFMIELVWRYIR